ncbi:MAG TPA: hypothetical protein VMF69_27635 [Gemmataceae bacterium]|nr:hypothetical protein [Gemmataceae bacterium]
MARASHQLEGLSVHGEVQATSVNIPGRTLPRKELHVVTASFDSP